MAGTGVASAPLTLVVKRPDGVEYKRVLTEDQGDGGRSLALALLPGIATGTWRVEPLRPEGSPCWQTSFLVEDYVPERLELTLTPQTWRRALARLSKSQRLRVISTARRCKSHITGDVEINAADQASLPALKVMRPGCKMNLSTRSAIRSRMLRRPMPRVPQKF